VQSDVVECSVSGTVSKTYSRRSLYDLTCINAYDVVCYLRRTDAVLAYADVVVGSPLVAILVGLLCAVGCCMRTTCMMTEMYMY